MGLRKLAAVACLGLAACGGDDPAWVDTELRALLSHGHDADPKLRTQAASDVRDLLRARGRYRLPPADAALIVRFFGDLIEDPEEAVADEVYGVFHDLVTERRFLLDDVAVLLETAAEKSRYGVLQMLQGTEHELRHVVPRLVEIVATLGDTGFANQAVYVLSCARETGKRELLRRAESQVDDVRSKDLLAALLKFDLGDEDLTRVSAFLRSADENVRREAAAVLHYGREPNVVLPEEATRALLLALDDDKTSVRESSARALRRAARSMQPEVVGRLTQLVLRGAQEKEAAAGTLPDLGPTVDQVTTLLPALNDESSTVRVKLLECIFRLGKAGRVFRSVVEEARSDPVSEVSEWAELVLQKM